MPPAWAKPVVRTLKFLILGGLTGVLILVAGLWIEHASETSLPQPTGPFAVGRTVDDWVDEATVDLLAPVAGTKRELLVWVWYPATPGLAPVDDYKSCYQNALSNAIRSLKVPLLTRMYLETHTLKEAQTAGIDLPGQLAAR